MTIHKNKSISSKLDSKLKARIEAGKTKRELWRGYYEEGYRYALPQRENFSKQTPGSEQNEEYQYDSTAQNALQDLAANIQSNVVPAGTQWAVLEPADTVKETEQLAAANFLQNTSDIVFKAIQNSNLDTEIGEALQDLGIGTGALAIEPTGNPENPINCTAIPADELILENGPYGTVETVFREYKMSVRNLCVVYPGCSEERKKQGMTDKGDEQITVIEGVVKNYDTGMYEFYAIDWDKSHVMMYDEMDTSPYVVFRWSKKSGEVWGSGPVLKAIADIRALNQLAKLELQNAAFVVNGVYKMTGNVGAMSRNFKIEPGAVIVMKQGQNLEALDKNRQLQTSNITGDKLRDSIKQAMFADRLPAPTNQPVSATEIRARQQEFNRVIGPVFGRLTREMVVPIMLRFIDLLQKSEDIEDFIVDKEVMNIKVQSPVTRNTDALDRMQQMMIGLTELLAPFGEAGLKVIGDNIDLDKLPEAVARDLGVDLDLLLTKKAKETKQASEAEQAEEANLTGQALDVSEIAKNLNVSAGDMAPLQ